MSKKKAVLQQIVSDIKWFSYSWNHSWHHTNNLVDFVHNVQVIKKVADETRHKWCVVFLTPPNQTVKTVMLTAGPNTKYRNVLAQQKGTGHTQVQLFGG